MASPYTPHALALPPHFSPDTLDVLTELADVLQKVHESARESLQRDTTQQTPSQKQATQTGGQTPSQSTGAAASQLSKPGAGSSAVISTPGGSALTPTAAGAAGKKLTFKDVPGATDGIKHKLQKAREQVRALPDMERTVAEQQTEIEELEARIERQTALLGRLKEGGLAFGREVADRMEI
jgi:hypothetical protein